MKKRKYIFLISFFMIFFTMKKSQAVNVEDYNYEIFPILAPFNNFFYVKTNNPDPDSFRLVDKSSIYIKKDNNKTKNLKNAILKVDRNIYKDVEYENIKSFRVKGGYIFKNQLYDEGDIDGGELIVQKRTSKFNPEETGDPLYIGNTSTFSPSTVGTWEDTKKKIYIDKVYDGIDYLINTKTKKTNTLFENLDIVQSFLDDISIYPTRFSDTSKKIGYSFLATSPYPELSLNSHIEMVNPTIRNASFLYNIFPFVWDSASTPLAMTQIAKRLDSDAKVSSGWSHSYINVTKNGVSKSYGGAGRGGTSPVPINTLKKYFLFNNTTQDFYVTQNIKNMSDTLYNLKEKATEYNQNLLDEISGKKFAENIGTGTWIKVGAEGYIAMGQTITYVAAGPEVGSTKVASKAWVDGRYVNVNEQIELGKKFEDYPTADIILRNQTYTRKDGTKRTSDIVYSYDKKTDTWRAPFYYNGAFWYNPNIELPDRFILTRQQVMALKVDSKTHVIPSEGKIYDGTANPGTPFSQKNLISVEIPAKIVAYEGEEINIEAKLNPSENIVDGKIKWELVNNDIVKYAGHSYDNFYDRKKITLKNLPIGKYTLKVISLDGNLSSTSEINILPITKKTIEVVENIPYKIQKIEDSSIYEGQNYIEKKGIKGQEIVKYEVVYKGDVEYSRKELSRVIKKHPIAEILRFGTKKKFEKKEILEYETEIIYDKNLVNGETKIVQEGVSGEITTTYDIYYKNGYEISRKEISRNITKKPINRIISTGEVEGWKKIDGVWKYYKNNGDYAKSEWLWVSILNKDGNSTGKYNWKYFNRSGENIEQFYEENQNIWLSQKGPNSEYKVGWWTNPENNMTYYFRLSSGMMVKGRQYIDGGWKYFRQTGTQAFGWQYYNNGWRYNDPQKNGTELISLWKWLPINNGETFVWKYFNRNGKSINQFYNENGYSHLSLEGPNLGYKKGWWTNPENNQRYYFRVNSGTMVVGYQYINGCWRYFRPTGTMVIGKQFIAGKWYYFDYDGKLFARR